MAAARLSFVRTPESGNGGRLEGPGVLQVAVSHVVVADRGAAVNLQQEDYEYMAKKLSFEPAEWERILTQPNKKHTEFKTDAHLWRRYHRLLRSTSSFRKIFKKK